MVRLVVHSKQGQQQFQAKVGQSVREILDTTALRVRAACGGTGTCGACRIRLAKGTVSPLTVAEYLKLSPSTRTAGGRLACQLRLQGDTEIWLSRPAPPSPWKSILPENLKPLPGYRPTLQNHPLGVAVDLGTTHIRVSLLDRRQGKRIGTRCGLNPQRIFGTDILNRLEAARASPIHASELAKLARNAIIQAVRDILARDIGEIRTMLAEIGQVIIVGNTAMLALLTGQGREELINPVNWQRIIHYSPRDAVTWQKAWSFPNAEFILPPPAAGFVGSDLLADIIATGLTDHVAGALLVDIGTNIEIALWDGHRLYATSAPGGPAFEGSGIRHGMPAEAGAIHRVYRTEAAGYGFEILSGGTAKGFCGSGLIDAIALLVADGQLKPSGRFTVPHHAQGYRLDPHNPCTAIMGADIDIFQRAKAATAAAMLQLLAHAGIDWADVRRLCLCGAFGHTLNIQHAQDLGLLPQIEPTLIELHTDTGLAACEQALLAIERPEQFLALSNTIETINFSWLPDYDLCYVEQLRLCPMPLPLTAKAT